jgi:hypothetical protein
VHQLLEDFAETFVEPRKNELVQIVHLAIFVIRARVSLADPISLYHEALFPINSNDEGGDDDDDVD